MRISIMNLLFALSLIASLNVSSQVRYTEKGQAYPSSIQRFGKEAFAKSNNTVIRWLGSAGFLINSRGTSIMVDPMLVGFDMPLLIQFEIGISTSLYLPANGTAGFALSIVSG